MSAALLEVDAISRRFGGLNALKDVSFSIKSGEIVGLIGPNGAGKTTCFNVVSGVMSPSAGAIRFEQRSIVGKKPSAIVSEGLVRTFQATTIFPDATVIENVMRGAFATTPVSMLGSIFNTRAARAALSATRSRCELLLERLSLLQFRQRRAGELSYGGQRRLGVAIALAARPKLLMLDEPVAGLNPEEAAEFGRLIKDLHKTENISVLLVEHHMRLVMGLCDRLVVLDHGEKIAEGIPSEIRANRSVIQAYLGAEEAA
ncbi:MULTISPECIES: ABC transporter ATP-binding protein [unclassified Bradyrhizobium]|uniref:ABC transporter ATP-binding protein n=1 Tax=unclassified Bradyrhizobium TaxID=2631580 RepID=UPI001BAD01FD|nr:MULTISPECIES: ABC transporter ATP-binding protein [unclassified Bradyrhizobium]MBR1228998.1 ABC transporter ATP-binding protein [Bradyrhizobium sp. AUGA SZCCT0176]MBR1282211.1 ABC transporter ATP-binding protein [Bradyrhizobium sp. AUGA SZCCT0177]MBR1299067.1 ABC transporter ATP-binding protein [Bradyrhizobium sp. AUGA SZCCT0042]